MASFSVTFILLILKAKLVTTGLVAGLWIIKNILQEISLANVTNSEITSFGKNDSNSWYFWGKTLTKTRTKKILSILKRQGDMKEIKCSCRCQQTELLEDVFSENLLSKFTNCQQFLHDIQSGKVKHLMISILYLVYVYRNKTELTWSNASFCECLTLWISLVKKKISFNNYCVEK